MAFISIQQTEHTFDVQLYGGQGTSGQLSQARAQEFIAVNDNISQITLGFSHTGTSSKSVEVRITSVLGGTPLASQISDTTFSSGEVIFVFATPISVTKGQPYFIEIHRYADTVHNETDYNSAWLSNNDNPYHTNVPNHVGAIYIRNNGTWVLDSTSYDYYFKIYSTDTHGAPYNIIPRDMTYMVAPSTSLSKSLGYAVRPTFSLTKPLQYAIIRTPSTTTKNVSYAVDATVSITKPLGYTVISVPTLSKSTQYNIFFAPPAAEFSPAVGGLMVGQYYTPDNGTVTQLITKALVYAVTAGHALTKPLTYMVDHSVNPIQKTMIYTLKTTPATITKPIVYTVRQAATITKVLAYAVKSSPAITKQLLYRVLAPRTITKSLSYTISHSLSAVTKPLAYVIASSHTITKGLTYATRETATITKGVAYSIVGGSILIQKNLTYLVTHPRTVTKAVVYEVKTSSTITKSLDYALPRSSFVLTKPLSYLISAGNTITKSLAYQVVSTAATITKGLVYSIVAHTAVAKPLKYAVVAANSITKPVGYTILTTHAAISKSIAYGIRTIHGLTQNLSYFLTNKFPEAPSLFITQEEGSLIVEGTNLHELDSQDYYGTESNLFGNESSVYGERTQPGSDSAPTTIVG